MLKFNGFSSIQHLSPKFALPRRFNGIKGKTVDAALLVPPLLIKNPIGDIESNGSRAQNDGDEPLRFSYVISSSPKYLLAL